MLNVEQQGWLKFMLACLLMVGIFLIPEASFAGAGGGPQAISGVLKKGHELITGETARWVAIIVLVFFGVMCLLGRLQITTLLLFIAAFALIFGADKLVDFIKGGVG
jgi:type IV secretory pathway VirB2 component (pilin)